MIHLNTSDTFSFLRSAFEINGAFFSVEEAKRWLKDQNDKVSINIDKVKFNNLDKWKFTENNASLIHESGGFFSIEGLSVKTNYGIVDSWDQPIINQPEIGYLGIICKSFNGVLHFLMQAKIEPGNVNYVQLSPTLQATRSNYTQKHKGKKPLYLEYFQNVKSEDVLLDQLQSEQGGRFYKKRNRNIIIKVDEDIPVYENFIWLTLAQIKKMIQDDNLVNMDTRTVISGIPYGTFDTDVVDFFNYLNRDQKINEIHEEFLKSMVARDISINSFDSIICFLTRLKSQYDLDVDKKYLSDLNDWHIGDYEISHKDNKYFKVIGVNVEIGNREVVKWCQPMVEPAQEGLCAFVCKSINGVLHFAVQAKLESGNFDVVEFAPTVQCLTGNYKSVEAHSLPFLDYVLDAPKENVIFDTFQSEEGGRFFQEQNRNMIVMADDTISEGLPDNYIWMTLSQLHLFLKFNNFLNIQARSLISAISFI